MTTNGQFLKHRREELNLSQEEVAVYVGVNRSAVSRWEKGIIKNMGVDKLKKLSTILRFDPMLLINDEDEEKDSFTYFNDPTEAMRFLLEQNVIMGFNGLDITKLSEDEQIEYANEMLNHLKLLSYKYKGK